MFNFNVRLFFIIIILVLKNNICFSQEPLGVNDNFNYQINCNLNNQYDLVRTDQDGNIIWKISYYNSTNGFDSSRSEYIVFGYTNEKNGKITSTPSDYDYWFVPKKINYDFLIYPNPNLGTFNIYSNYFDDNTQLEIFDGLSRLVLKNKINDYNMIVNLNNYPKGFYFIKIFNNETILKFEKICIN